MHLDPRLLDRAHDAFMKYWTIECGLEDMSQSLEASTATRGFHWKRPAETRPQIPETLMLDDLLALVFEFSEQPVASLRPVIRLLVLERMYMDQGGDSIAPTTGDEASEHYVDTIVRVLEKVRQQMVFQGHAVRCPVPPLMCG